MAHDYNYRPKYVDIRVRKPPQTSVHVDGPPCQHPGCKNVGETKAPKSRDNHADLWLFCKEHARLYNQNWNYFEGMSDEEYAAFQKGQTHGQRQTWDFRTQGNRRRSRAFTGAEGFDDPLGTMGGSDGTSGSVREAQTRTPAPIRKALADLGLEEDADKASVRAIYAEMVRRFHPDSNGGDRSAEDRLNAVVKAYKVLKTARRA